MSDPLPCRRGRRSISGPVQLSLKDRPAEQQFASQGSAEHHLNCPDGQTPPHPIFNGPGHHKLHRKEGGGGPGHSEGGGLVGVWEEGPSTRSLMSLPLCNLYQMPWVHRSHPDFQHCCEDSLGELVQLRVLPQGFSLCFLSQDFSTKKLPCHVGKHSPEVPSDTPRGGGPPPVRVKTGRERLPHPHFWATALGGALWFPSRA